MVSTYGNRSDNNKVTLYLNIKIEGARVCIGYV